MAILKILFVLVFAQHVVSDGDAYGSIIDPLIVPSVKVLVPNDAGIEIIYQNLNITGMDERQLIDSDFEIKDKWVWKKYKVNLHVVGDITFKLTKQSKSFSGGYTMATDLTESFKYTFEFKEDYQGIRRTVIKEVTYKCDNIGDPQITISPELAKALEHDPAAVNLNPKLEDLQNLREAMICTIGGVVFTALVDSYRVAAQSSPSADFLEKLTVL